MARPIPKPPHPTVPMVDAEGRIKVDWRAFFEEVSRRIPVFGTATFAAATTVAVTLAAAEPDAGYHIALVDLPENNTFWVTSQTTLGFTINAASVSSATIGWALLRA